MTKESVNKLKEIREIMSNDEIVPILDKTQEPRSKT